MEIRLLTEDYNHRHDLYEDFMADQLNHQADYFSSESVYLDEAPDFPIYMGNLYGKNKNQAMKKAYLILKEYYIHLPRHIHMNGCFWHSLLMTKRDYLMELYGDRINDYADFKNIILKKFDWENYIYKCVLAAEYIEDASLNDPDREDYYFDLIVNHLDLYNYIIKYSLFRNSQFILNYFQAIDELGIGSLMKEQIKNRDDLVLGEDERYGRRVFQELNNNYPVVMAPFLSVEDLKNEIIKALSHYLSEEKIGEIVNN